MTLGPPVVSCDALLELCAIVARSLPEESAPSLKGAVPAKPSSDRSAVTRNTAAKPNRRRAGATHRSASDDAIVRDSSRR
jgi:hypothetical protein